MQKLLVAVLALLVSHAAGGLASGLAGSLALAAAAGLNALGQVTSSNSLDTLHDRNLSNSQKFIAPGIVPVRFYLVIGYHAARLLSRLFHRPFSHAHGLVTGQHCMQPQLPGARQ